MTTYIHVTFTSDIDDYISDDDDIERDPIICTNCRQWTLSADPQKALSKRALTLTLTLSHCC